MISFIPLPVDTHNTWAGGIPGFTIYAATSNLSVTLALTLMTIGISHYEGIRANGTKAYFKSWVPDTGISGAGGVALTAFLIPLEVLSQFLRIISLSVRLFANMLAGHLLIIMCLGFAILLGNVFISAIGVPVAVAFYLFELGPRRLAPGLHLRDALGHLHRRRDRAEPLTRTRPSTED